MCRIFGAFGNVESIHSNINTAFDLLYHGGPDEQGATVHKEAFLGNCRLAIMDPNNGSQPYKLGNKIEVVFNGEIYNHNELRKSLMSKGYTFENNCDGAILPALYREYGQDFVSHLDGMFAIAVLDRRESPKLTVAVDHLGMKPLYYSWDSQKNQLTFASEIPALVSLNGQNPSLWLPGVDEYLTTKVVTGEHTMYKGINVLTPQTILTLNSGDTPKIRKWARPETDFSVGTEMDKSSSDLRDLLTNEVSSLLCADVPLATINSGGLDSSLVSALSVHCGYKTTAFHLGYSGDWPSDERHFAHQVTERLGIHQKDIMLSPSDFPDILPEVVRHMGQPYACPNNLSTYGLFRGVSEAGFKVVLSGDGADEMFGGYSRINQLSQNPQGVEGYINAMGILTPSEREELYSKEYLAYVRDRKPAAQRLMSEFQEMKGDTMLEKALEFERTVRLPAYHLRRVDHLSMAHSVEVRVPFCQKNILDFARRTPSDLLVGNDGVKKVLYAAGKPHLPDAIINRPKQPFTLPVGAMFRGSGALSSFSKDVLSADTLNSVGLFNPQAVDKLFAREQICTTGKAAEALWALTIFHLWATQPQPQPSPKINQKRVFEGEFNEPQELSI